MTFEAPICHWHRHFWIWKSNSKILQLTIRWDFVDTHDEEEKSSYQYELVKFRKILKEVTPRGSNISRVANKTANWSNKKGFSLKIVSLLCFIAAPLFFARYQNVINMGWFQFIIENFVFCQHKMPQFIDFCESYHH